MKTLIASDTKYHGVTSSGLGIDVFHVTSGSPPSLGSQHPWQLLHQFTDLLGSLPASLQLLLTLGYELNYQCKDDLPISRQLGLASEWLDWSCDALQGHESNRRILARVSHSAKRSSFTSSDECGVDFVS